MDEIEQVVSCCNENVLQWDPRETLKSHIIWKTTHVLKENLQFKLKGFRDTEMKQRKKTKKQNIRKKRDLSACVN